jgi:hypothetical protein
MDDLIVRFFSIQVLEKIVRLERFLNSSKLLVRKSDLEVIETFIKHLDSVKAHLYSFTKLLGEMGEDLPPKTHRSLLSGIATVFKSIDELHLHLAYVKGQWTCPETSVFVRALFEPAARELPFPQAISVVLSDTYMFEETDLATYLADKSGLPIPPHKTPTLFLPKVEVENPLQWAGLVHEMGHALFKPVKDLFSPDEINAITRGSEYGKRMLNSWVEEMYCDIISLHLLGPAYLASFVDFITLAGSGGFLEEASDTHPYPPMRIYVMWRNLGLREIRASFQNRLFERWDDISEFFYSLFELRSRAERQHFAPPLQEVSALPAVAHELRSRLEERVNKLLPFPSALQTFDKRKFSNLSKRLSNGIPIGAYSPVQIEVGDDEARMSLKELAGVLLRGDVSDASILSKPLASVRARVREAPCTIAEIVNAGWLYKCEQIYADAATRIQRFDKGMEEEFALKLLNLDNLLRNSIETSYLATLFSPYLTSKGEV